MSETKQKGFIGQANSDEQGNPSAPRTGAWVQVCLIAFLACVGVYAGFNGKTELLKAIGGWMEKLGLGSGALYLFAQLKSGYVLGEKEKAKNKVETPKETPTL